MPATTSFPAPTDRQVSFYNTLAAERGIPTIEAFAPGTTRRMASEAIDTLMAQPRVAAAPAASNDGDLIDTPSAATRPGRMLLAGGIEATATLADGRHVTVNVRTRKRSGRGWTNGAPGEEGARTNIRILGQRVGWITVDDAGIWTLTLRTRREEYRNAILGLFAYAAGLDVKQHGVARVQEASRCGRCFRTLTDPVSIDRGIGPECFGRDTGSQHVAREREANGTAVEAAPTAAAIRAAINLDAPVTAAGVEAAQADFEAAEAEMNRMVAEREREQEAAAYEAEMAEERAMALGLPPQRDLPRRRQADSITALAGSLERRNQGDIERARGIIVEALDAYYEGRADQRFALEIFDRLAR